jgi:hypothetical protein
MTSSKFKSAGICLIILLAIAGFLLVVFKCASPPSGYIEIKYGGLSTSGVFWSLNNRSSQSIYIQGTGDKVWPDLPITKCKTNNYSPVDSDLPYFAHGSPSIIKIPPGGQFRFDVETSLPQKYKGGHCYVRLRLLGGAFVESDEFTPN